MLLLLASALQIGNTIRLATSARRREIGIMRLVGSNFYITVPFLLGAVISALIGVFPACLTMAWPESLDNPRSPQLDPIHSLDRLARDCSGHARRRGGRSGACRDPGDDRRYLRV